MGRRPVAASQARTSRICSATWMCNRHGRVDAAQCQRGASQVRERHRAQAVECRPGAQQEVARAALSADALFDGAQELLGVQEKSRLLRLQRPAAEIAALIERRQKRQTDAGIAGRLTHRLPQRIGARIARAAGGPMQIVKFRHRGVA